MNFVYVISIIVGYVLVSAFLGWLAGKLIRKFLGTVLKRISVDLDNKVGEVIRRPISVLIFFIFLEIGRNIALNQTLFHIQASLLNVAQKIIYTGMVCMVVWGLSRIMRGACDWYLQKKSGEEHMGSSENHIYRLISRVITGLIYFVGFTIILGYFNVSLSGFLATAGVASLAISLAAQDTMSNIISGFMIMLDKPFRVGDRISSSGLTGDVVDIGGRSTRLKTIDNTLIVIPNSDLVSSRIVNYSNPSPRTVIKIPLGVAYGSDLKRVKAILEEIMLNHEDVLDEPTPRAYFL
ncbi:MAG: mechanosensitive ion channel family protein [Clostridia bacterium]|nr:mechanosensitive ion channel family protein [Clostridia bacterium]